jgi:hypothetical protein
MIDTQKSIHEKFKRHLAEIESMKTKTMAEAHQAHFSSFKQMCESRQGVGGVGLMMNRMAYPSSGGSGGGGTYGGYVAAAPFTQPVPFTQPISAPPGGGGVGGYVAAAPFTQQRSAIVGGGGGGGGVAAAPFPDGGGGNRNAFARTFSGPGGVAMPLAPDGAFTQTLAHSGSGGYRAPPQIPAPGTDFHEDDDDDDDEDEDEDETRQAKRHKTAMTGNRKQYFKHRDLTEQEATFLKDFEKYLNDVHVSSSSKQKLSQSTILLRLGQVSDVSVW